MKIFTAPDYIERYEDQLLIDRIIQARKSFSPLLHRPTMTPFREPLLSIPIFKTKCIQLDQPAVIIGDSKEFKANELALFKKAAQAFVPWKKGPFTLFDINIDTEWRSNLKWERFFPHLKQLKGSRIADIGCHNGYFMFRMAHYQPELIIGFEPHPRHYYNFQLMQNYAQISNVHYEIFDADQISHYPSFFDHIFCLGLLYHLVDPIGTLKKFHNALRTGGKIIVDCQGVEGNDPIAFVPGGRYANARGIWFLPTLPCLKTWLRRSGFKDIKCFYAKPLDSSEQRATKWAPIKSLEDFLDPKDRSKTIEGYPAPIRFYLTASK